MAPSWEKLAVNLPSARGTANPGGSASTEPELEQEGRVWQWGLLKGSAWGQVRCFRVNHRGLLRSGKG